MRLILASLSPYRQALIKRLGISIDMIAHRCDETAYGDLAPDALARRLAVEKAKSVGLAGALVIGSDQVVDLDGAVIGKPHTPAAAQAQLARLQGRSHRLVTAVAVHDLATQRTELDVDVHVLTMRPLTETQIARYVAYDNPIDCAGSYKLESRGIALFDRIEADPETADDTAIIGLPLMKTLALLRRFGVDIL